MTAPSILDEITYWKRAEIAQARGTVPIEALRRRAAAAAPPLDLAAALRPSPTKAGPAVRLIAEIKRASPSRGPLAPDLDPARLAAVYASNGAAAISVLTDERFFGGRLADLQTVRAHVAVPVLRKDFILDPYQVYEARAAGADAILLITAALQDGRLAQLYGLAGELGMAALVEVHDEAELERALTIGPAIIGVNNRDLRTFQVDLETTARLRPLVPPEVILVAESGVRARADVERLAGLGADAMLVGEALVQADDVGRRVRELIG